MRQSVSLITLGVSDYERAKAFYEAIGWTAALDVEDTAFFQGNVASAEDVDALIELARRNGAEVVREPSTTFYGGYAGYFRDPDGHVWEVAHNPGFGLADDGSLILPGA
jgi:uncharacterized protein